jgi:Protein of unknown function (DUF1761)
MKTRRRSAMLVIFGFLLFITFVFLVLLLPALTVFDAFKRYSGSRAVVCPENHRQVAVSVDALHAATSELEGHFDYRVSDCTRWPERWRCNRACVSEALHTEPYQQGETVIKRKRIYHLPVLLAAFAAWYIGAFWHSHLLFRQRWMQDLGLTTAQLKELVEWYSPHLMSMAACLLFAYGVAWLVALSDRTGIVCGILNALLLGIAVAFVTSFSVRQLSSDLVLLEVCYGFIAAIVVGAIVGGLNGKLVLSG